MTKKTLKHIARLSGYEANRISDLSLHLEDLRFAESCINEIGMIGKEKFITQTALWRSAIIHFLKCFSESAKFRLSPEEIFSHHLIKSYGVFLSLKNKFGRYAIHNESTYKTIETVALILDDGGQRRVEGIYSRSLNNNVFQSEDIIELGELIEQTRAWVEIEKSILMETMKVRVERTPGYLQNLPVQGSKNS